MYNNKIKYYLKDEIVTHNTVDDFWVVIHYNVLDLTPMLHDRRDSWNINLEYLLAFGGKDLSYLFEENGLPKTEASPVSGQRRVLFPPILEEETSEFSNADCKLWSQDPKYFIGRLTRRERNIRIINTLTGTTQLMKVCDEDTIYDIQRKYKAFYNHHAGSYLWRKFSIQGGAAGKLRLECTLDDNGLTDEKCESIELPPPSLWLYYTNDYTVA